MDIKTISIIIGIAEIALGSLLIPLIVWIRKTTNGQKCQLRQHMLDTYYKNKETKLIHQYEYENFVFLYEAYKALKGNSFIDKIYAEIKEWEVIP